MLIIYLAVIVSVRAGWFGRIYAPENTCARLLGFLVFGMYLYLCDFI